MAHPVTGAGTHPRKKAKQQRKRKNVLDIGAANRCGKQLRPGSKSVPLASQRQAPSVPEMPGKRTAKTSGGKWPKSKWMWPLCGQTPQPSRISKVTQLPSANLLSSNAKN